LKKRQTSKILREESPVYHTNGTGPKFKFIDLFCGIGGFRIAFQRAGCECVFSSDWNEFTQKTYAANFGETPHGDIYSVPENGIPPYNILCAGLGVAKRRVLGFVASPQSEIADEFYSKGYEPTLGVFIELALPNIPNEGDSRLRLLSELERIHQLGWIVSKQLNKKLKLEPCRAPQCGGFTLEAELGIPKNSDAEPDFSGWEVKQYAVDDFEKIESSKPITLMTPEPSGGYYKDHGVEDFIRKFGYADKMGRQDRINCGGRHFVGQACAATKLTMELKGFDAINKKIIDADGEIELLNADGEIAASWSFKKILEHWSRKHMQAVYVPSKCRTEPERQYSYGHLVRLAQKTDSLKLLEAFAAGAVYYDPGIKLERASSDPEVKRRSQFRVASKNIAALYETVETVEVRASA